MHACIDLLHAKSLIALIWLLISHMWAIMANRVVMNLCFNHIAAVTPDLRSRLIPASNVIGLYFFTHGKLSAFTVPGTWKNVVARLFLIILVTVCTGNAVEPRYVHRFLIQISTFLQGWEHCQTTFSTSIFTVLMCEGWSHQCVNTKAYSQTPHTHTCIFWVADGRWIFI